MLGNPLHYATECRLTESFHLTKPAEVNRVARVRAVAGNKLSRNKISQLMRFLADNEALIKLRYFPLLQVAAEDPLIPEPHKTSVVRKLK
ncbi:hypothetical protein AVEN_235555-1 [Araneus ventricosus]|uniref:Uncharacterized protein n=1 Tax=Araneus ventricosus TaxID=182803 RepID=A0A4Y2IV11_ARAVE|nr:hypothetical protein AVEN_235555-1 [Araneus ventricosus]